MAKKFSYFNTSGESRGVWEQLCPPDEYRVLPPSALSGLLPDGHLAKADSVLLVASGCPQGTIVYMANVHRVDAKVSRIDQDPLGIVFHGNFPAMSGCRVHHGAWSGRTVPAPPEFWQVLAESGIGHCYAFSELPSKPAGPISDLKIYSQHAAFSALVDQMKGSLISGG